VTRRGRRGRRLLRQRRERRILGPLAGVAAFAVLGLAGPAPSAVDGTPPVITPSISGTQGSNGWYVSNATLSWHVSDPETGLTETSPDCRTRTFTADTTGVNVTCWATNGVGLTGSYTATVRIDKTPPSAAASLDRQPDFNGWYTRQLTVRFSGGDGTSGLAFCSSPAAYAGPETGSGQVSGMCRDRAGNERSATAAFKYDATAPEVTQAIPARSPDRYGWYNRPVDFSFAGADATSGIASCSTATYSGPNNEQASVTGTCWDNAGHASAPGAFYLRYSRPLLTPASGENVRLPVTLDWVNVPGARFYNVQVWRGTQKILSVWPSASEYRFKPRWRFEGERRSLVRGARYRWYVWPRMGRRYGPLVGRGFFDVVRGTAA
jgi:hypothetical protein